MADFFLRALEEHRRILVEDREHVFKDAPETAVTLVKLEDAPCVCVKEFRWRGPLHACKGLLRPTQGVRALTNGRRLVEMGIGAPLPLALVTRTICGLVHGEWVIMEAIPDAVELDRFVIRRIDSGMEYCQRRELIRMFARFLSDIHAKGIFHADLKTCNIMVSDVEGGGACDSFCWTTTMCDSPFRFL